jgi:CheY-like chemotaxis protein
MKKILIVEDDFYIQDIFKIIFKSYGYEAVCVDAAEAIDTMQDTPDIIIMDKQLPHMSGIEACKRLKQNPETQNIPVIMISATAGIQQAALAAGADDFLEKPFNMHLILKKVSAFFNEAHAPH